MEKVLEKKRLPELLDGLKKRFRVFGPVDWDDKLVFKEVRSVDELQLNYSNSKTSPKGIFFPQTEKLFRFRGDEVLEETPPEEGIVILGMRPCDARGFTLLDLVFQGQDFQDPYYLNRRSRSIVISTACSEPRSTCFCISVGGRPDSEEGADILLYDLGETYLVRAVTEKGEILFKDLGTFLKDAHKSDLEKRDRLVEESMQRLSSRISIDGLKQKLDHSFEAPFWDEFHLKCLGCGICTYLCPTCHCFDITDESLGVEGERLRSWDSCMFPLFTLHASGHNPRPTQKERMRQRIMHKFNYCPEDFGETFCCGCGRCILSCPVNLDIRELIKEIVECR